MRSSVVLATLVASFGLTPVVAGYAPAFSQDFSITNQVAPGDPVRRDLIRQLQAWWDLHAYYPRHALDSDEGGTVRVRLNIAPDGKIMTLKLRGSSGSSALDAAGLAAFRGGAVRPFADSTAATDIELSLHYVLAHRGDQPVPASYTPAPSKAPFTIMNDPVKSPILETMLQRTCTGTATRNGSLARPWQGVRGAAQAIFFRKPDGTPWVKFYENGQSSLSPVTELGKMLQWVGPLQHTTPKDAPYWITWVVWADGPNHLSGAEGSPLVNTDGPAYSTGLGGPVDLTCATEVLPTVTYNNLYAQTMVSPPQDPP